MLIVSRLIYKLNTIPIMITIDTFVKLEKLILELTWRSKKSRRLKTVLKKKKIAGITSL